jgi:hypothetical protein
MENFINTCSERKYRDSKWLKRSIKIFALLILFIWGIDFSKALFSFYKNRDMMEFVSLLLPLLGIDYAIQVLRFRRRGIYGLVLLIAIMNAGFFMTCNIAKEVPDGLLLLFLSIYSVVIIHVIPIILLVFYWKNEKSQKEIEAVTNNA